MTKRIVFSPPGPDAPGYLKRLRRVTELQAKLSHLTPETLAATMTELGDFLLDFVSEPQDREEARALLDELSYNELSEIMTNAVGGSAADDPLA